METAQTIGNICVTIASILWTIELIPQIIKTLKYKSVGDISIYWLLTCLTAYIIYLTGMVFHENYWYFLTHLLPTGFTIFFIYLLLKYKNNKHNRENRGRSSGFLNNDPKETNI